eukprot:gnl/Ergobibamus_cyprinoides/674.p1 GENE.gnl/Ergobibamus_cyprinoides/674~~gnl/Ergobibamus_cyprinoides/674.p1  ORF type:complete len:282 (+),score=38.06 gnl/Ergobibamus_cyprinoides/674:12-857(+)
MRPGVVPVQVLIPCHRLVLAHASEYFHALLRGGWAESARAVVPLPLSREEYAQLQHFVRFIYSGSCTLTSHDAISPLFSLARRLQVQSLESALSVRLHAVASFSEAWLCAGICAEFGMPDLEQLALQLISDHFAASAAEALRSEAEGAACFSNTFARLSPAQLAAVVSRNAVYAASELQLYSIVARYVLHHNIVDSAQRLRLFSGLSFRYLSRDEVIRVRREALVPPELLLDAAVTMWPSGAYASRRRRDPEVDKLLAGLPTGLSAVSSPYNPSNAPIPEP